MAKILNKLTFLSDLNYYSFLGYYNNYNDYQSSILLVELMYEELQNSSTHWSFLQFAKKKSFLYSTYTSLEHLSKFFFLIET